jgi:hypothetical protein
MASFSRKTGIIGALVIAGVLVVGAFIFSSPNFSLFATNTANAESTQTLLKAYAQKDSDNDGLPDWEESLYGLDPHNPHSFSPNMTDGEAVARGLVKPKFSSAATATTTDSSAIPGPTAAPNSVTDQFAQDLFKQITSQSNGTPPTQAEIAQFAQSAIQSLVQNHSTQNKYSLSSLKISDYGPDALRTYAIAAEKTLAANDPGTSKNELDYFSDAVNLNDAQAFASLKKIGAAYSADGPSFMNTPTPAAAQYAHLEVANALTRMGEDVTNMSAMNTDPLRAYLGLAAYQNDSQSMLRAFSDMSAVFQKEQITILQGQPGGSFYNALLSAAKQQTEAKNLAAP